MLCELVHFWSDLYSTAVLCGDPGTPAEGYMEGKQFTYRSEVIFYCRGPYILVGSSRRVCQDDGSWSGVQPTCVGELTRECGPVVRYLRNNPLDCLSLAHHQTPDRVKGTSAGRGDILPWVAHRIFLCYNSINTVLCLPHKSSVEMTWWCLMVPTPFFWALIGKHYSGLQYIAAVGDIL